MMVAEVVLSAIAAAIWAVGAAIWALGATLNDEIIALAPAANTLLLIAHLLISRRRGRQLGELSRQVDRKRVVITRAEGGMHIKDEEAPKGVTIRFDDDEGPA